MAEIRVTCPSPQLLIAAIPVQFVDGEALVSEAVAEELRPYVAAHGLELHAPAEESAEAPAEESAEAPAEESAEAPAEESAEAPKGRGKQAASPFGN